MSLDSSRRLRWQLKKEEKNTLSGCRSSEFPVLCTIKVYFQKSPCSMTHSNANFFYAVFYSTLSRAKLNLTSVKSHAGFFCWENSNEWWFKVVLNVFLKSRRRNKNQHKTTQTFFAAGFARWNEILIKDIYCYIN